MYFYVKPLNLYMYVYVPLWVHTTYMQMIA